MAPPVYIQLPLFILDKRCTKCGLRKPLEEFGRGRARCRICRRQESRAHYRAHIERHRATALAYYYAHLEQQRATATAWKRKNREKVRSYNHEHAAERAAAARRAYPKRRAYDLARSRQRYATLNKERRNAHLRAAYKVDPEPIRMRVRRRDARKRACEGTHTLEEWKALKASYGYRCLCCGTTERQLTADHVIPITRGGTDYIDNIQPLCRSCNSKKHDKIIDYRPGSAAAS